MKLKKILAFCLATVALPVMAADDGVVDPDSTGFKFTDVKLVKCTSVKDQNKSGTCWCFSGNSFFENEILRATGKEVDLSEMYVVRKCYEDKARKFLLFAKRPSCAPYSVYRCVLISACISRQHHYAQAKG